MTATTKLALELLQNNAANQTLANTTFAQLNQLVQAVAVDRLTTPPGSPADEALYIITATATGAWSGKEDQLAYWLAGTSAWQYITPREGFRVHVNDEDEYYKYDGSAWGIDAGGGGVSLPVVQALSSTRNLELADINTFNVNSTTNNYTATIPPESSVAWTADAEIHFLPSSTGEITITGGTGVSVNGVVAGSVTLSTQNGAASIKRTAADTWWVGGALGTQEEQRTALGLGAGDSPTLTALTLTNGQIVFPVTQVPSANANTLDDYEEGTWTPTLTFVTPGDLSVVYSTQSGRYTKTGRHVATELLLQTSTFTHTTASGELRVTGLPFTNGSTQSVGSNYINGSTFPAGVSAVVSTVPASTSFMRVVGYGTGSVAANFTSAQTTSGVNILIAGSPDLQV